MKKHKPTTPSRRQFSTLSFRDVLTVARPHKPLTQGKHKRGGRNHFGRITTPHQGGGHKRRLRDIDFTFNKKDIPFTVTTVEYDPNRSGFIGLVTYHDGEKRYTLLPKTVGVGAKCIVSETAPITAGNRTTLAQIPVGTYIFNIELKPGAGAKLVRSAGTFAEVLAKDAGYVDIKMPSSEVRKVREDAWASIGSVSNEENKLVSLGKAGRSRWLGIRPTTRGTAQNPVDHPMGGGEGRSRGQRKHKKTKQGRVVDPGKKTRRPKKYSNKLVVSRRKTKR